MPMPKAVLPSLLGVGGVAAGGAGGFFLGKRRGGEQMATALSSEFMKANQQENAQLARLYFRKGLQYNPSMKKESSMDKNAVLEQVYSEAFGDELCKIAASPKFGTTAKRVIEHLGQTGAVPGVANKMRWAASGIGELGKATGKAVKGQLSKEKQMLKDIGLHMGQVGAVPGAGNKARHVMSGLGALKGAPVTLAAGGLGVAGLGTGGYALANRK